MSTDVISVRSAKTAEERQTSAGTLVGNAGAAVAVVLAGLAVAVAGGGAPPALYVSCGLAVVWAGAGVVLGVRHRCPAALLVTSVGLLVGVGAVSWAAALDGDLDGAAATAADLGQRLALALVPAILFHLLITLPDGTPARPAHRQAARAGYGVAVIAALLATLARDDVSPRPLILLWPLVLTALPVAHTNYRAAPVSDQRRMQWIGWATVVAAEIALVCAALSLIADWPHDAAEIALAATALVPLAMAAGTVPRLSTRVDRLLTHTVSLTGLTALIVGAYVLAITAFGRRPDGTERTLLLLSMLASAGAALAYQPARAWLNERANRLVYGERTSPDEALRTWGSRLTRAIPMDELLLQLVEALRKSMQLRSAQIWTGTDGHYEVAAMVPHRTVQAYVVGDKERGVVARAGVSGGTWLDIWLPGLVTPGVTTATRVAPIAHSGELLGLIVCERAVDAAPFTEEDDRVLTELARQVGLALHNVVLDTALQASLDELRETNEELRASRVRIVAAGDAERRKLERNLHDGAQQHLVALAVKLRLAKDAVADDPEDAEAMIDEIRADLQEAIAELRALAHGIFPPLLVSGGLAEALPAAAARAALPTSTEITVDRHAAEVEAAVYFCCMEALQNAGKHAGPAATAVVRVWQDDIALHWEVRDDGPGFDTTSTAGAGHGFVNMRDRMGSFGGHLDVVSGRGAGTTIRGALPLVPA